MATVKKRKEKKSVYEGNVYIQATFNNTIVTITDLKPICGTARPTLRGGQRHAG